MATTSQALNINHTYAKESEGVGECVCVCVCVSHQPFVRHAWSTQSITSTLPPYNKWEDTENKHTARDFLFQFLLFLENSIFKSAGFSKYCWSSSEIGFLLTFVCRWKYRLCWLKHEWAILYMKKCVHFLHNKSTTSGCIMKDEESLLLIRS